MDIADNQSGDEDDHQGGDDNAYIFKIGDRVEKIKGSSLGTRGTVTKVVGDKIKARYDSEYPDDNIECYIQDQNSFALLRATNEEDCDYTTSLWEEISNYLDINMDNLKETAEFGKDNSNSSSHSCSSSNSKRMLITEEIGYMEFFHDATEEEAQMMYQFLLDNKSSLPGCYIELKIIRGRGGCKNYIRIQYDPSNILTSHIEKHLFPPKEVISAVNNKRQRIDDASHAPVQQEINNSKTKGKLKRKYMKSKKNEGRLNQKPRLSCLACHANVKYAVIDLTFLASSLIYINVLIIKSLPRN